MDIYNTFAGALVLGTMLLIGSAAIYILTTLERTLRTPSGRDRVRRLVKSALGIAAVTGLAYGLGSLAFERAFDSPPVYVPRDEVRWEPAGKPPTASFDRFEYGSASNAELAQRS